MFEYTVFPAQESEMFEAFIQKMFPAGNINGRNNMEVNGLPAGSVPQNVTIIKQWQDHWDKDRREFYHVTDGEYVALLRVCKAGDYVAYDEFVVIHDIANAGTSEAYDISNRVDRWSQ